MKNETTKEAAGTMTLPEKLGILNTVLRRMYNAMAELSEEDLKSPAFLDLMTNIRSTERTILDRSTRRNDKPDPADPIETADEADSAPEETMSAETTSAETAPEETASAETAPAETAPAEAAPAETASAEAAQAETAPTPAPTLTKAEVRAQLLDLSGKYDKLDIAAVMESLGYARLSDVPEEKYGLLLEKAAEAVRELS